MKTRIIKVKGDWQDVVNGCRATVKKPPLGHEPSDKFKEDIIIAEHEPIREIEIKFAWDDIPYCIAMHWKTHIWPSRTNTSREDRTGIPRNKRYQTDLVNFEGRMNLQHQIDTFRKRLCYQADPQTREYAEDYKAATRVIEPQASDALVPNCVYRCGCPEINGCGIWDMFVNWCMRKHNVIVQTLGIHERYRLYNEWFYTVKRGGEKND